jgi:hypothetical protein
MNAQSAALFLITQQVCGATPRLFPFHISYLTFQKFTKLPSLSVTHNFTKSTTKLYHIPYPPHQNSPMIVAVCLHRMYTTFRPLSVTNSILKNEVSTPSSLPLCLL